MRAGNPLLVSAAITIISALMLVLVLAPPVSAGLFDSVTAVELVRTPLYGAQYTPQCLENCHMVLKIKPTIWADLNSAEAFKSNAVTSKGADGNGCLKEVHYNILVNKSYAAKTWFPDVKCSDALNKTTGKTDKACTDNGSYKDVISYGMAWVPIKQAKPSAKEQFYYIDLVAKKSLTPDCKNIDAIPELYGQELKEFAWWNTTWGHYKTITFTNNGVGAINNTVFVNVSHEPSMNADFSDLRFVTAGGTEYDYWIEDKSNGNFADVWIRIPSMPNGDTSFSMYYNNTAASTASNGFNAWAGFDDFSVGAVGSQPAGWSFNSPASTSFTIVNNITKYAQAAMIQDGADASEPIASKDMSLLTKFRYISQMYIHTSPHSAFYFYMKDSSTVTQKFTGTPKIQYYSGGWNDLMAWSQDTWYRARIEADTDSDLYNLSVNGVSATGLSFRTASAAIYLTGYQSDDGTKGNEYIGVLAWGNYSGSDPVVSFGAEQSPVVNYLVINGNRTNGWSFKNGDFFSTNITAAAFAAESEVTAVYIELNGVNNTAAQFGGNIYNWNTTLSEVPHGGYQIRQFAQNGTLTWETNSTAYFTINVTAGLNASFFDGNTGSAVSVWSIYVSNGTANYTGTGLTNPSLIPSGSLPRGNSMVTFFGGNYSNASYARAFANNITQLAGYGYRLQEFRAADSVTAGAITSFSLTAANSSTSSYFTTSNGVLLVGINQLPVGTVTFTTAAFSYGTNSTIMTVSSTSIINRTEKLRPAGLEFYIYDEKSGSAVTSNVTLSNSTYTWTLNNTDHANILYTNGSLPQGAVTVTLAAAGYNQRVFYEAVSSSKAVNSTYYMLATTDGSWIRFHIYSDLGVTIPGAMVTANRTIGGNNVQVAAQLVDGSGTSLMFLEPIATYSITASAAGYNSKIQSLMPSSADYYIYLSGSGNPAYGSFLNEYGISGSCSWVNTTVDSGNITCTIGSNTKLITTGLRVWERRDYWDQLCDLSSAAAYANYTCYLGNTTGRQFYYMLWGAGSPTLVLKAGWLDFAAGIIGWGIFGVFITFVAVLGAGMIGGDTSMSVILSTLALTICSMAGMVYLGIGVIVWVIVVAAVVALKMRS